MGVGTPICFHLVPVISLNPHEGEVPSSSKSPTLGSGGEGGRQGQAVGGWGDGCLGGVAGALMQISEPPTPTTRSSCP